MYKNSTQFEIKLDENTLYNNMSTESKYCILIIFRDIRCNSNTLWKSEHSCKVHEDCKSIPDQTNIPTVNTEIYIYTYFYWTISVISLIICIILVMVCLMYARDIYCMQGKRFCIIVGKNKIQKINAKSNKSNILKNKKETVRNTTDDFNTDIVLLYSKGSESYMTLMAEFRGVLGTACQCSIHDWYNATDCNHVAEIGGADWFAEMLNRGSRVIWVDTPTVRSLITRRFKKDLSDENNEHHDFMEISDFRDIAFPIIFDLAKRNVEHSMLQQAKHFIVRLKGYESCEDENDPFVDLSPHTRYIIPQDLNILCSELSLSESNIIIPYINEEDDLNV
ncbi:PREDICTED: uncharacterized protein LOC107185962 [Dufourea novaeangliae]|uniref:uncharacterized protein LOC107185962 n=1 Tax=Dufourea novaeangliae TaxID=178035 RepID=UPI000767390B|nr:PREDICTED: uncharacterized protein LOC107185962 [Dufourea novaeangliae]